MPSHLATIPEPDVGWGAVAMHVYSEEVFD
jgi:hypothetical protein